MKAYGKETTEMAASIIEKKKLPIGELKDIENAIAERDALQAFIDYNVMMGNIEDPGEDEEEEDGTFAEV